MSISGLLRGLIIGLASIIILFNSNRLIAQQIPKAGYPKNATARPSKPFLPVTLVSTSGLKSLPPVKNPIAEIPEEFKSHPEFGKKIGNSTELIHLRTINARTYTNTEGTFTTEQSSGNLHYKDSQGRFISLSNNCENSVERQDEYGIFKTDIPVSVNLNTGASSIGIEKGASINFSPEVLFEIKDGTGNIMSSQSSSSNSRGVSNGNEIIFKNFWPNIDRVQLLDAGRIKTNYIIQAKPKGIPADGFIVFTESVSVPSGWSITTTSAAVNEKNPFKGKLEILNASGKYVGSFEPLIYFDEGENSDYQGGYVVTSKGNSYNISAVVPADWLLSDSREYPVTIDPTVISIYSSGVIGSNHISNCTSSINMIIPVNSYVTNAAFELTYSATMPSRKRNGRISLTGNAGTTTPIFCDEASTGNCALNAPINTVANGFYATGIVPVTLNVSRTNAGSGGNCSTNNISVNNSTWITTLSYMICPALTTPSVISGPTTSTCGQTLNFNATGGSGSMQWEYSSNGGSVYNTIAGATTSAMSISFNVAGTYLVRLKNYATYCNDSYSNLISVVVGSPLTGSSIALPISISSLPYNGEHISYCYPTNFSGTNSQGTPAMYFRFTTGSCASAITINTCHASAGFDTYIFLLDASGNVLTSNDDYTGCAYLVSGNNDLSQIENFAISPSTNYYVVVQGYSLAIPNSGIFGLNISQTNTTPQPSVTISADASSNFCTGGLITLNANPVNGGTPSYTWTVNDLPSGNNLSTFSSTSLNNGDQVAVTMVSSNTCASPLSITSVPYSVVRNAVPVISAASNSPLCNSADLNLTSTSSDAGSTFNWSGPAGYSSSDQNPMVTGASVVSGVYNLTVTGTNNCISTSSVNVNSSSTLNASVLTFVNPACVGSPTGSITVSVSGGNAPYTYLWSNGSTSATAINLDNGTYTVTVTDANSCTATTQQILNGIGVSLVANAGLDRDVCNLFSLQLQALPAVGGSGTWSVISGSGTLGDATDPLCSVSGLSSTVPNTFRWTVTGPCGSASDEVTVNLFTAPPPNQPTVTGPLSGCTGDTLSFSTNLSATNLIWTARPDGVIFSGQGTQNAQIIFGTTTSSGFHACVQGSNVCGSNVVKCLAVRTITCTPRFVTGSEDVCDGVTTVYKTNVTEGAINYKWTANPGVLFNGNPSPFITSDTLVSVYFPPGYISTKISVATSAGCAYSTVKEMAVFSTPLIPNVIVGETQNLCNSIKTYSVKNRGNLINEWTVPTGSVITYTSAAKDTIKVQFTTGITGNISLRSKNSCGVFGPYRRLAVTTLPATPGTITGPVNVCPGSIGNNYSIPPIPGISNYIWTVPTGGQILSGLNLLPSTATTGNNISVNFGVLINKITVQSSGSCGLSNLRILNLTGNCRTDGTAVNTGEIGSATEQGVVKDNFNLQAFPDAETRMLTVTFNSEEESTYTYKLIDQAEQEVLSGTITALKGNNMEQIDMSSLPDAIFRLVLDNGKKSHKLNIRFF